MESCFFLQVSKYQGYHISIRATFPQAYLVQIKKKIIREHVLLDNSTEQCAMIEPSGCICVGLWGHQVNSFSFARP